MAARWKQVTQEKDTESQTASEPAQVEEEVYRRSRPCRLPQGQGQRRRGGAVCSIHSMAFAAIFASQYGVAGTSLHYDTSYGDGYDFSSIHAALCQAELWQGRDRATLLATPVQGDQKQDQPAGRQEGGTSNREHCEKGRCQNPQPVGLSAQYYEGKLNEIDEQWEAYRNQWANYLDKASQMWMSHVESFEDGENKFAARRKEALQKLQSTRSALHEAHQRTMEQDGLERHDIENAKEGLDASMSVEEQEESESQLVQIKEDLTGIVRQVRTTIEERIKKRERSRPREASADVEEVEVVEPADKKQRDSA